MKAKKEIQNTIKKLQASLKCRSDFIPEKKLAFFKEQVRAQIRALKWVLEHKQPASFYCTKCTRTHREAKCPLCGNNDVMVSEGGEWIPAPVA